MANEITIFLPARSGQTNLFAVLTLAAAGTQGQNAQVWNTATPGFEAFSVAHWASYKIALAEAPASSGYFTASVPSGVAAGLLSVTAWQTSGGTPTTDTPVSYPGTIDWSGSAVATVASRSTFDASAAVTFRGQDGVTAPTVMDALSGAWAAAFGKWAFTADSGVYHWTTFAPDRSTPVRQFVLDNPTSPTYRQ